MYQESLVRMNYYDHLDDDGNEIEEEDDDVLPAPKRVAISCESEEEENWDDE